AGDVRDGVADELHGVSVIAGAAIAGAGHVVEQRAEPGLAFAELGLHAATLGDIGADADDAPLRRPAVGDTQPAAVGHLQLEAAYAAPMASNPLLDPRLGIGRGLRILAARDGRPHDVLECATRHHQIAAHAEELAVPPVAGDETLVGIPQDEPFAHALQRVGEARLRTFELVLDLAPLGDVENDAIAIDRLARLVEDATPALEHASYAAILVHHPVLDLIGPLALEAVGYDAGDSVDIFRVYDAGVGADRVVDELAGRMARELLNRVADEF